MDCSPPGSSVHVFSQVRTRDWDTIIVSIVIRRSVLRCVQLFVTPWTAALQVSLSFTIFWSLLKHMSIKLVMPSNHLILSPSPAFNLFQDQCIFTSDRQSIGASASASVLPMNVHDWFPLGLTCLIFLKSKGLSKVFSNTTVQKHQFFGT